MAEKANVSLNNSELYWKLLDWCDLSLRRVVTGVNSDRVDRIELLLMAFDILFSCPKTVRPLSSETPILSPIFPV